MNNIAFENLLEIARQTVNWKEQSQLLLVEDQFFEKKEFLWLKEYQLRDRRIQKYLALGSLPFYVYDTDHEKDQRNVLNEIWPDKWLNLAYSDDPEFNGRLPTLPRGNMRPTYMIIGDAPGIGKSPGAFDRTMTFGPSSHMLRKALVKIGIYYDVWFTNLVKVSQLSNKPTAEEDVQKWQPYLLREIALLEPKQFILLGNHVSTMFEQFYLSYTKAKVSRIYHPSYIVRIGRNYEQYAEHIQGRL